MRVLGTAIAVSAALWLAAPAAASAAEARQDFTLVNATGYDVKAVYVSPARSNDWEEDVLGDDTLDDGTSVNIHFAAKTKTCRWDLKVVYAIDDTDAVWQNIDLCKVAKITIYYNKKNDKTRAVFD